jgi:hypothetical protein
MSTWRLVRHVMWFDLRAQWLPLGVWAVLLLVHAFMLAVGPEAFGDNPTRISLDYGLLVIRLFVTVLVAGLLVQSDALVGTTAFWMTRPIPRGSLFIAKISSAVAWLVITPMLIMGAVLLYLGLLPRDALLGAMTTGVEQTLVLAMALMAAVVTSNLPQVVVAGIAGVTLVTSLNGLLLPGLVLAWPSLAEALHGWQPAVYATVVIVGAVLVACYQYLTLRAWHAVAMIGAVMLVATGLTRLWPPASPVPEIGPPPASVLLAGTSIGVTPGSPSVARVSRAPYRDKEVSIEIEAPGLPPAVILWPVAASTEITADGMVPIRWSGATANRPQRPAEDGVEGQPNRSIREAVGDVDLLLPPAANWIYRTDIGEFTQEDAAARGSNPARLRSDLTFVACRYRVTAAAPLAAGARLATRGKSATIVSTGWRGAAIRVGMRETFLTSGSPVCGSPWASYYVLRNQARRQAVSIVHRNLETFTATLGITTTAVMALAGHIEVELPADYTGPIRLDDEWLRGAELLLVEPEPVGTLTRAMTIDRLVLEAPPKPATGAR